MAKLTYKPLDGDELQAAPNTALVAHLRAFITANPSAVISPTDAIGVGALHPYLKKATGKRATIAAMLTKPVKAADFETAAKPLGGGYLDAVAAIYGGFARNTRGTCYAKVTA